MFKNAIIFSVYQASLDEGVNFLNSQTVSALMRIQGLPFKEVIGYYKGNKEVSFVCDDFWIGEAKAYALKYNQESVLVIEGDGKTFLEYLPLTTNSAEFVGYFREVPKEHAITCKSYTYDPATQKYFVATKEERNADRISFDTRTWEVSNA